jgi:hypothetical protein
LETFRCPTCVTLLPDPYAHRCFACGQTRSRRPPQVLGEEHRIGANLLPIDRWMLDRLRPEPRRRLFGRNRHLPPVAWHGRFATSARPPECEPAWGADTPAAARVRSEPLRPAYDPVTPDDETPQPPATVGALALDVFVRPAPAAGAGARSVVAHEELDPEVRALVDELYERARAELSGRVPAAFMKEQERGPRPTE